MDKVQTMLSRPRKMGKLFDHNNNTKLNTTKSNVSPYLEVPNSKKEDMKPKNLLRKLLINYSILSL